ncbi:hypothetical protein vBEliSR6L_28 [Erythrobacter phage vB_EliS_R6L]|nr:hypothetical protein vBEliSR6L_28 [Erythrobacter phage vB_EliS_R6L]
MATDERALFPRLDDSQLNAMVAIAKAPLPALPPVEAKHLNQSVAVLDAALPRRKSDDASGALMLAAYRRKLEHMPKEQLDFMCNAILERCRWFPTIAECLEIAAEWTRADARERARARNLVEREQQARLDDALRRLKWEDDVTQAEVDGWPEGWRRIAATQGLLYRDPDRLYQIRPRLTPETPPTTEEPECPTEPPSTEE